MKQKLSFLVLTDHRLHKEHNPVYSLLPTLKAHPDCFQLDIASRGNSANDPFFYEHQVTSLEVLSVSEEFKFEETGDQFINTGKLRYLQEYDGILMRLERPIESAFMTFLVDTAKEAVFINHPLGIEATSNKAFILNFPTLCPPMKLCNSIDEIIEFAAQFPIVLKPLKGYGGKGIVKVDGERLYKEAQEYATQDFLQKHASHIEQEGYLAMKFLEQVVQGDKRILLVGDTIMGASLRIPAQGSWLCNVAQGGKAVAASLASEEEEIIDHILPILRKEGILIAGIDTLVGDNGKRVLSEINTLSVGGFEDIQKQSNKPIIQHTIQTMIDYVRQNR
jgi:glutathione synthase